MTAGLADPFPLGLSDALGDVGQRRGVVGGEIRGGCGEVVAEHLVGGGRGGDLAGEAFGWARGCSAYGVKPPLIATTASYTAMATKPKYSPDDGTGMAFSVYTVRAAMAFHVVITAGSAAVGASGRLAAGTAPAVTLVVVRSRAVRSRDKRIDETPPASRKARTGGAGGVLRTWSPARPVPCR
jgi:hypothetical protein